MMDVIPFADTSITEEELLLTFFSHQIAGTASDNELQYLEEFKRANPDKYFALQSLSALWKAPDTETDLLKNSFKRLIERMKKMGIDIDDSELK